MINKNKKTGMAGIVTVVLIMGLLMTVAISYIKMMDTENSAKVFTEQHDRALDAAFCGISYAMAFVQSDKSIFRSGKTPKDWPYIKLSGKTFYYRTDNDDNTTVDLASAKISTWNYMNETMMIIDDEQLATAPYRFRVVTYPIRITDPADAGKKILATSTYMVKSQGEYFVYEGDINDGGEVVATYTAQYLAELQLKDKRVYLKRYKVVPYQSNQEFYKYLSRF